MYNLFFSCRLSNRDLTEIDSTLFNQLTSLQCLDISQNQLTDIPHDLRLPKLQILDVANNQLQNVNFVKNFKNLREFYIEENPQLKVVFISPKCPDDSVMYL